MMKKVQLFMFEACPYCQQALKYLNELLKEEPYRDVQITMIDERKQPDVADAYDYYYVPTFYVDDVKVSEGAVSYEQVKEILDKACL